MCDVPSAYVIFLVNTEKPLDLGVCHLQTHHDAPVLCSHAGADVNVRNKADLDGVCASIEWSKDMLLYIELYFVHDLY